MIEPNFIILYVTDPATSARFYEDLLGRPPVESSPTFAMFALSGGVMLGLWARHTVSPPAEVASAAQAELGFTLSGADALHALHERAMTRGWPVLLPPTAMEFGLNFVMADPDGHRLRPFVPARA